MDAAAQYALAYALTTSAGLRAILPLALLSGAIRLGLVAPPPAFDWLGSAGATIVLGVLAVVEVLADKIPIVDHVLHFVQVLTKPAAAAILVGGAVHAQSHAVLAALMIVGALNALGVHAVSSSVRLGSTATTAGAANPFISAVEDGAVVVTSITAFFAPILAAAFALILVLIVVVAVRALYRRVKA
ncbi:MAG TPA: DUF4126 domain-containing protein [Candidatus Baltobacteraceae bacterium]|nr:DUF4126 domain-containing protein [Candidatus Baltobacteraceae bacterium]